MFIKYPIHRVIIEMHISPAPFPIPLDQIEHGLAMTEPGTTRFTQLYDSGINSLFKAPINGRGARRHPAGAESDCYSPARIAGLFYGAFHVVSFNLQP